MTIGGMPLRLGIFGDDARAIPFRDAVTQRMSGVEIVATGASAGSDFAAATGDTELDAVIVATDTPGRAALVAAALERGIHVCCPLPVTGDLSTLDSLILRAVEADVVVFTPNPLRYAPPLAKLHAERRSVGAPAALWAAHRTVRNVSHLQGDVWTDLALPLIDAAIWCADSEVERVQVLAERLFDPIEGEGEHTADAALILLRFATSLVATLEVARSLPDANPLPEELTFELLGRDAILRAVPTNQAITVTNGAGVARENWLPDPAVGIVQAFVAAIDGTAAAPQTLLDVRWSLPVLEKVRLAAATGEMVRVGGALRR